MLHSQMVAAGSVERGDLPPLGSVTVLDAVSPTAPPPISYATATSVKTGAASITIGAVGTSPGKIYLQTIADVSTSTSNQVVITTASGPVVVAFTGSGSDGGGNYISGTTILSGTAGWVIAASNAVCNTEWAGVMRVTLTCPPFPNLLVDLAYSPTPTTTTNVLFIHPALNGAATGTGVGTNGVSFITADTENNSYPIVNYLVSVGYLVVNALYAANNGWTGTSTPAAPGTFAVVGPQEGGHRLAVRPATLAYWVYQQWAQAGGANNPNGATATAFTAMGGSGGAGAMASAALLYNLTSYAKKIVLSAQGAGVSTDHQFSGLPADFAAYGPPAAYISEALLIDETMGYQDGFGPAYLACNYAVSGTGGTNPATALTVSGTTTVGATTVTFASYSALATWQPTGGTIQVPLAGGGTTQVNYTTYSGTVGNPGTISGCTWAGNVTTGTLATTAGACVPPTAPCVGLATGTIPSYVNAAYYLGGALDGPSAKPASTLTGCELRLISGQNDLSNLPNNWDRWWGQVSNNGTVSRSSYLRYRVPSAGHDVTGSLLGCQTLFSALVDQPFPLCYGTQTGTTGASLQSDGLGDWSSGLPSAEGWIVNAGTLLVAFVVTKSTGSVLAPVIPTTYPVGGNSWQNVAIGGSTIASGVGAGYHYEPLDGGSSGLGLFMFRKTADGREGVSDWYFAPQASSQCAAVVVEAGIWLDSPSPDTGSYNTSGTTSVATLNLASGSTTAQAVEFGLCAVATSTTTTSNGFSNGGSGEAAFNSLASLAFPWSSGNLYVGWHSISAATLAAAPGTTATWTTSSPASGMYAYFKGTKLR